MRLRVELGVDVDGRWCADLVDLPGCYGFGSTPRAALGEALELAGDAFEVLITDELELDISARRDA